jgi:hypothetical protein
MWFNGTGSSGDTGSIGPSRSSKRLEVVLLTIDDEGTAGDTVEV